MNDSEKIEIPLSKLKLTLMLIGSILFLIAGTLFVIHPEKYVSLICYSPAIIFITGIAGIVFGGICVFMFIKKLADKTPGLIISKEGIFDNSGGISVGFIPWSDITDIGETKVEYRPVLIKRKQTFINIIVKNPRSYIDKQKNPFKRNLMDISYSEYGTAIGISANGLQYDYNALMALLRKKFKEYKQNEH